MARNQPVTDAELNALREEMREQREEIRADLEAASVDVSSWTDDQQEARADGDE